MGARFRALMNAPEPLVCPGAYDVLSARLVEVRGFKSMFIGSSAVNQALLALPDQAVVTVSEIIDYYSLTDLDRGDLKFTTDFRDIYYELLSRTVGTDPTPSVGTGRTALGFL